MSVERLSRRTTDTTLASSTRDALIQAAGELISSTGYQRMTVEEVRVRAGVSRASFYFYFRDKKHLFLELIKARLERNVTAVSRHTDSQDAFSKIVAANIAYFEVWSRTSRISAEFLAQSLIDDDFHALIRETRAANDNRVAHHLQKLIDAGEIPPGNALLLAMLLSSMVEFFAFRFFATDDGVNSHNTAFDEAVRVVSDAWYRVVYGAPAPHDIAPDLIEHERAVATGILGSVMDTTSHSVAALAPVDGHVGLDVGDQPITA